MSVQQLRRYFRKQKWDVSQGVKDIFRAPLCTCSLEMISSLVILTMAMSSTAKAGYEMMASSPASTSLDMEALGSMEVRMD